MDYENLLPDSEWIDLEGLRVRIISRQRLIAIKKAITPTRTKDLLDIQALERETDSP